MRSPGKGAIIKLSGKRKKPYAIRITTGWENGKQKYKYLSYHESYEDAEITLHDYLKNGLIEPSPYYHHKHDTRIYRIWCGMIGRCKYSSNGSYKYYGGRGITVCNEWLTDFTAFYNWAMANGYTDELTIDRIDSNGNYEPSNCCWATYKEQNKNRRKKA